MRSQAAASIAQRIREYLAGVIHQELEVLATESPIPLKVIASYMAGSLIALITWWLENDMPYSPEYMSQIFSRLTMPGVRTLLAADAAEPLAE